MQIAIRPRLAAISAITRSAAAAARAVESSTAMMVRAGVTIGSAQAPPRAAVAGHQFLGFHRALAAGLVALQTVGAGLLPGIEERLHRAPAGFDAIGALEQDV